jgi:hypothetical protein
VRGRKGRKRERREGGKEEGGREAGRDGGSEDGWMREWSGVYRGGQTHTHIHIHGQVHHEYQSQYIDLDDDYFADRSDMQAQGGEGGEGEGEEEDADLSLPTLVLPCIIMCCMRQVTPQERPKKAVRVYENVCRGVYSDVYSAASRSTGLAERQRAGRATTRQCCARVGRSKANVPSAIAATLRTAARRSDLAESRLRWQRRARGRRQLLMSTAWSSRASSMLRQMCS